MRTSRCVTCATCMLATWNASTAVFLDLVVIQDGVLADEHFGHRD